YMRSASISDADINQCTLYRAESIERVDKYIRLPNDEHGNQVNYVIMQPWGENNNLVEQKAKSGDILVFNPDDSIYFNSGDAGTLDTFVNAETGEPLKVELVSIVSLTTLLEQKHEEKSSSKGTTSPQVAMESREFSNPSRKLHEISKDPEALTPQDTDPSINTIKHI
ncbi:MAG: hypothetical protein OEY79_04265, partial [Anaplasmataceae bacterium]|nr:hypothetical protein [Anaplasmataceae bacterium]